MLDLMFKRRKSTWKCRGFLTFLICFVLGCFCPSYAAQQMALTGSSPEKSFNVQIENLFPGDSITRDFDITASYKKAKAELHYEIKVSLPTSAGNEYQNQKIKTDFIWMLEEVTPGRQANVTLKIVGQPEELVNGLDVTVICRGFNEGDQELRYEGKIGEMVISPDYIFKTSAGGGSGSGSSSGSGSVSGNNSSVGPGKVDLIPSESMEEEPLNRDMTDKVMAGEKRPREKWSEKSQLEERQLEEKSFGEEKTEKPVSEYKQETKEEKVSGEIKESAAVIEMESAAVSEAAQQADGYSWCCIWWMLLVLLLVVWYLRKKRKEAKKKQGEKA